MVEFERKDKEPTNCKKERNFYSCHDDETDIRGDEGDKDATTLIPGTS